MMRCRGFCAVLLSIYSCHFRKRFQTNHTVCAGAFSTNEFHKVVSEIVTTAHLEHLHNNLISAIAFNVSREPPEPGVASWVSANDKPTAGLTSKPAPSGDVAEQRLKTEVKHLPPRDRRRLKGVGVGVDDPGDIHWGVRGAMESYHSAMQMRAPDAEGGNKGGLSKTSMCSRLCIVLFQR